MSRLLLTLILLTLVPLCTAAVPQYTYRILEKKPQDRGNFVQGLEILDGKLYVSAGGYGKSRVIRYDFASGASEVERRIDPRLWAEGLTVLGDRLYLLTWKARVLFVFDKDTLEPIEKMRILGQGWGLTNDGKQLIFGDGSDRLFFLDPSEHRITRAIRVTEDGRPLPRLNELEWIDGRIWANVWLTDRIVIIDPADGKVERDIDMKGLLPVMERRGDTDVLNGIARNPADGGIWVTGKNWPWMYRIEILPTTPQASDSH